MNDSNIAWSQSEPHNSSSGSRLNWLRASVLGANDGIVSIAGLVVGVAGASNSAPIIFTAGLAGLIAGALSMAVGEYVSVSTQRDTERASLEKERQELQDNPEKELAELVSIYQAKGLKKTTALVVAKELTDHNAFAAHVDAELGINPNDLTNPWHAAIASAASFVSGAVIPLIAIIIPPANIRVAVTFLSVVIALVITGMLSAKAGGASARTATIRVVLGGVLAMLVTFGVGKLFGAVGI